MNLFASVDTITILNGSECEHYWGGDYAAATLNHSVELLTVSDPVFQACITDAMDINGYTNINQITTLSCNSIALVSIEGVELLTSLTTLNIAGSSVSVLSPVLQSSSLLSLSFLEANGLIYTIMDDDLTVFKQWIREHIACKRLWIPSCIEGICPPFFTDRCDNGTCHYDHDDNTSSCTPWYEEEIARIKADSPFIENVNDSWNDFYKGTQEDVYILESPEKRTVDIYEGKFKSWEYNNGFSYDINIHFYAAKPEGATGLPVLIYTHGYGGAADYIKTNILAAELNMFVIYYSAPGRGSSTGTDHTNAYLNNKMFDSTPEVRESWFWADAVAGMRAITLATENNDVDISNVAMSGGSAGGIATLLASSVDNRIKAAVPFIASLSLEDVLLKDIDPGDGHINYADGTSNLSGVSALLFCSDVKDNPHNWTQFIEHIAGKSGIIKNNDVPTLFINGAVDSLFPLKAVNNTFNAMGNSSNRFAINYKGFHGGWIDEDLKFLDSDTYYWLKSKLTESPDYSFVVVEYDLGDPTAENDNDIIENYYRTFYISSQPVVPDVEIPSSPSLKFSDIDCASQTPSPPIMW